MKRKFLDQVDWNNIAPRVTATEGSITSLLSRMTSGEGSITSLLSRMTTAEGTISSHTTTIGSHTTDINALKTWRAAKATASPDVSTSFSVATDVITLGLAAPRASSINSIVATIMGEINGLKAILRSREILAT